MPGMQNKLVHYYFAGSITGIAMKPYQVHARGEGHVNRVDALPLNFITDNQSPGYVEDGYCSCLNTGDLEAHTAAGGVSEGPYEPSAG